MLCKNNGPKAMHIENDTLIHSKVPNAAVSKIEQIVARCGSDSESINDIKKEGNLGIPKPIRNENTATNELKRMNIFLEMFVTRRRRTTLDMYSGN